MQLLQHCRYEISQYEVILQTAAVRSCREEWWGKCVDLGDDDWWASSLSTQSQQTTLSATSSTFSLSRAEESVDWVSEYLQHQLMWVWEEAFNKYFHCSFGRLHTLIIDHEPGNILIINSWVHVEMIRIFTPQLAHLSQVFSRHYNEPICWTIFQWQVSSEVYLNVSPGVKLSIQLKTFTSHCAHVQHSPEMQSFDNFYFNKTS